MTRIAYVGNRKFSWTTETYVSRSLTALGCDVLFLQEDQQTPESIERAVLDFGADLVMYQRTWGLPPELIDVWRRLEARGVVTASYHLDLYVGLAREAGLLDDPSSLAFWRTGYVFSADGDPAAQEKFERMGINHHWLPPAVMHDECMNGTWQHDRAHDIVFVGSAHYHPEWPHRPALLDFLRHFGRRFVRYGNGSIVVRGMPDLNNLYASSKCAVGDSLCPGYTKPNYISDRIFEAGGRGAVQVFPRVPGVEDVFGFVDGEHLLLWDFDDWDGLRERIAWCVTNEDEARAMAARGQAFIRAKHTYLDRLAQALFIMGLRDSPDRPAELANA